MCMTECFCVCVLFTYMPILYSVTSVSGSDGKQSSMKSIGSEGSCTLTNVDLKSFKITWNQEIIHNRETWKAQAAKGIYAVLLLSLNKVHMYNRITNSMNDMLV